MATLLAHIVVKSGREAEFEALAAELYRETQAHDAGVLRYEYWRGAEPRLYYSLLSFSDYHAFMQHQLSDHHEAASPKLGGMCENVKLEWVDPLPGASDLPRTEMQPLPEDADEKMQIYFKLFAVVDPPWWQAASATGGEAP